MGQVQHVCMSVTKAFILQGFFFYRWSCSRLTMSFWECAFSWLTSNPPGTRAFVPLESLDPPQHPTFRHLTPVSIGNSWLFTVSVFPKSGWCGISCTIPNWAATTGTVRHPGLLSGGGGWKRWLKRRQTIARSRCLSRIRVFLHVQVGSARAENGNNAGSVANLRGLRHVQKLTWDISKLADDLWGNELAESECASYFSDRKANVWCSFL